MIKSKESYPQTGGYIIDVYFRGKGLFQGDFIIEERLLGRHLLQWHIIRSDILFCKSNCVMFFLLIHIVDSLQ